VDTQPTSPSLLRFFGLAILFIAPVIYLIIALNTGDLLWISPFFNAQPAAIVIHCYGEDIPLQPGSEQFNEINGLVKQTLTGRKRWDPLTLSAVTYEEYQTHPRMMVLELFYNSKIRIHSRYKFFSNVDTLIIPLDGRHAQTNAIFGRTNEYISVGSLHVKNTAPLVEYLSVEGICP
jgi:hypothetical protein